MDIQEIYLNEMEGTTRQNRQEEQVCVDWPGYLCVPVEQPRMRHHDGKIAMGTTVLEL